MSNNIRSPFLFPQHPMLHLQPQCSTSSPQMGPSFGSTNFKLGNSIEQASNQGFHLYKLQLRAFILHIIMILHVINSSMPNYLFKSRFFSPIVSNCISHLNFELPWIYAKNIYIFQITIVQKQWFFLFPQFSLNFGSHRKNVCTWICKMYETKYHNNTPCQ